jgi:hypothetical protein
LASISGDPSTPSDLAIVNIDEARSVVILGEDVGKKGGEAEHYEDRTVEELRDRAAELGIEGRFAMDKGELIEALRNH